MYEAHALYRREIADNIQHNAIYKRATATAAFCAAAAAVAATAATLTAVAASAASAHKPPRFTISTQ